MATHRSVVSQRLAVYRHEHVTTLDYIITREERQHLGDQDARLFLGELEIGAHVVALDRLPLDTQAAEAFVHLGALYVAQEMFNDGHL